MKKNFLILVFAFIAIASTAQEKKITASYYDSNEFGLALFNKKKIYPEFRVEAKSEQLKDASYSFFLRNEFNLDKSLDIDLSWGLGFSYSSEEDEYMRLPVYITKKKVFCDNLKLMVGIEFKTELADEFKLLPKIGVGINF